MLSKCQGCGGPGTDVDIGNVNVTTLLGVAERHAAKGLIDSVDNIKTNRYYLYRGSKDPCYTPLSVRTFVLVRRRWRECTIVFLLFPCATVVLIKCNA